MRGIQINNYFNNHITLNGKKVNQETQSAAQTSRQKLHNHQNHPEETGSHLNDKLQPDNKASPGKLQATPIKKRTNTLVELKKHLPQKRSISVERQRNIGSTKKKEQDLSDSQDKQEQALINMSHKKLRPNTNKGGLGKRSKSTIIKSSNATATEAPKDFLKKQSKKLNSNPTNESAKAAPMKSKRKKSSKIFEIVKQNKVIVGGKQSSGKKEMMQMGSKQIFKKQKLGLKIDKNLKIDKSDKKSGRTNIKQQLVKQIKYSNSKPTSARQKKMKKNRFIEQLKQKYENQTILQGEMSNRVGNQQGADNQFLSVMNSLQKILNSVGSKQKLKKQLDIINQKLKQFKLETQEEIEISSNHPPKQSQQLEIQTERQQLKRPKLIQDNSSSQDEQQVSESQHLPHKIEHEEQDDGDDDEIFLRLEGQQVKNPLISKKANIFFLQENQQVQVADERKLQIELLKKFKNQSTKMMQKAGLKNNNGINTQKIQVSEEGKGERKLTLQNVSGLSNKSNNSSKWQDKYPLGISRSPRFDESQLLNAIELKQQFISSKHDKMSELVKKMFEKQLVSPKSYQFQIKSLNKKYEQENIALESFKKQAEQLSSMLSEIKKDKQQIQGIDELIRNQKWDQAQRYVESKQIQLEKISEHEQYEKKWQKSHEQHIKKFQLGWEGEGGWERVKIKRNQVENNQFVQVGQLTNRGRRKAQVRVDIDQQCGGTQQSEQLLPHQVRPQNDDQECIYYNQDTNQQKSEHDSGLIRLVQIPEASQQDSKGNVFHIRDEQVDKDELSRNNSLVSPSQPQRGGFVTNLYFIKQYCIAICEFVRDNQIFKTQFRLNVSKPIEFNLKKMLTQFRQPQQTTAYHYSRRTNKSPIAQIIWNQFNNQYETLKYHSHQPSPRNIKQAQKNKLQKDLQIIFVKMVYDVLNQSLDFQRPGGQFGKALPWKETGKNLKNLKKLSQNDSNNIEAYDLMFGVAIARIIQWGSCLCGFLPDTVELENTEIDEAYVNHIRQTRTAFLLQKMMAQEEVLMTNFELEQTYIEYRLGELIYGELMEEARRDFQKFFSI